MTISVDHDTIIEVHIGPIDLDRVCLFVQQTGSFVSMLAAMMMATVRQDTQDQSMKSPPPGWACPWSSAAADDEANVTGGGRQNYLKD